MAAVIHIFFLLLAFIGLAIMVSTRNIVHAAYALCLTLIALAGVYVLLNAELMAVVQIMLYAGGVVILLVFGVMMTNRLRGEKVLSEVQGQLPAAFIALSVFSLLMWLFLGYSTDIANSDASFGENQIETIGISFLTDNLVAFELIAFILLVSLVGASYLAKSASDE